MKFLIAKSDPNKNIAFLLNSENRLFEANTIWEAEEIFLDLFGAKLRIGKIFDAEDDDYCFFATSENEPSALPDGWSFAKLDNLSGANCPDFTLIEKAQKILGY